MKQSFFILILFLSFLSCRKDIVKHPYEGTYDCNVSSSYWDMGGGSSSSETNALIEAELINDSLHVFGVEIHQDSLEPDKIFSFGYGSNYMYVHFRKDSMFMQRYSGGLGGGTKYKYAGRKIN